MAQLKHFFLTASPSVLLVAAVACLVPSLHGADAQVLAGPAVAAIPQESVDQPVTMADVQSQRERIARERAALRVRMQVHEVACYQRFAVNDCLREGRRIQHSLEDELRRQELVLNDMERRHRAVQTLARLQQNQSEQVQLERASKAAQNQAETAERWQAFEQRLHDAAQPRTTEQRAAPEAAQVNPADMLEKEKRFAQRQRDAQRRRSEWLQRNAENLNPAAPLPLPDLN